MKDPREPCKKCGKICIDCFAALWALSWGSFDEKAAAREYLDSLKEEAK